jgi:hypothetical protein
MGIEKGAGNKMPALFAYAKNSAGERESRRAIARLSRKGRKIDPKDYKSTLCASGFLRLKSL